MGSCTSNPKKRKGDKKEMHKYEEFRLSVTSYAKGLKTKIKELMLIAGLSGRIEKKIYTAADDIHDTPIHTEIIAGGHRDNFQSFVDIMKEFIGKSAELEIEPCQYLSICEEEKGRVIIVKTQQNIMNRKGSDAGDAEDDLEEFDKICEGAAVVAMQAKYNAKKVVSFISDLPIISNYTKDLKDSCRDIFNEQNKVLITTKSLFHPFTVYSFSMYLNDGVDILKVCISWKVRIPFDSIELYTASGILLTDIYTLMKDKNCVFADTRITKAFFEKESKLKAELSKFIKEPFVFHSMALHEMTMEYMIETFRNMNESMAQNVIKEDLNVSGSLALKILNVIK